MNKTEAIVLRAIDYGETNKIVTLLTNKYGKLAVLAKGANKPQSRLVSVTQPFVRGHWLLFGGNSGMPSVSQAELLESFRTIREDLSLSTFASCMAELTDRVLEDRQPYGAVFSLLLHMLRYLEEGKDPEVLLRIFEVKMFYAAGIQPNLTVCAHCGRRIEEAVRFSIRLSGPLCYNCHDSDPQAMELKPVVYKLIRLFQSVDITRLGSLQVGSEAKQQLRKLNRHYLEEQGGVFLKTYHFLDQIEKLGL
ncbi:DNA repair protein RecO [Effusibacillus dendaii]|uniref:DNA repair protein RecO n=1 Tax=Effusibacillus dendaii TaxID=2743772 RepID=A0A7I8D7X5_9BACL|nr:DNA repair protein RecO [Effusibacillus dendaii]BCJ86214.1 DNA repair protein RecO [Effusibacillus dendaii]